MAEKGDTFEVFITVLRSNGEHVVEEWAVDGEGQNAAAAMKQAAHRAMEAVSGNGSWSYIVGQGTQQREQAR